MPSRPSRKSASAPLPLKLPRRFAALDFETANPDRDSACAVSVVVVEDGQIVENYYTLIRPPRLAFTFTYIHGITIHDVKDAPTFKEVYPKIVELIDGAAFLAAHNAPFDASVMRAACATWELPPPDIEWRCTVRLARKAWNLKPARLPDVCRHLNIPLKHHDALSDATACARIAIAALSQEH